MLSVAFKIESYLINWLKETENRHIKGSKWHKTQQASSSERPDQNKVVLLTVRKIKVEPEPREFLSDQSVLPWIVHPKVVINEEVLPIQELELRVAVRVIKFKE